MMVSTFSAVVLAAAQSFSSMGPMPGEDRFQSLQTATDGGAQGGVAAGLGFGGIGEDFFLQLQLRSELNLGMVGFGFAVPLNMRVVDNDPQNEDDYYGLIREEDWDEPTDYLKVLRYVRLGHKRDLFYLRAGEIASELGHGTIMSRYLNNLDLDNFRLGLEFDVNTNYGGFESVIGDIGTVASDKAGSRLVGARGYVKPLALVAPDSPFNIFAVGATVVTDMNAPRAFDTELETDGSETPVLDADGNLAIAKDAAQTVYGVDVEAEVLHSAILDIVPYTDLNFIDGGGWGLHVGTLFTAKMPIGLELTIPLRVEYRRFKSNYVPIYFGTFYEVERESFALGAADQVGNVPKSAVVRALPDDEGINGYYADLAFDFAGLVQFGAIYEDYEGGDPNVAAFVNVPALEVIQAKAYYTRTGVTDTADIFKLDERSLAVAEARYQMMQFIYLVGRWTRRWVIETDTDSAKYGTYVSTDDYNVGIEAAFTF